MFFALCPVRQYVLKKKLYYTVEVEGSARLSAVRWTAAGSLNDQLVKSARQTGEFYLPPDKPCDLHSTVSQYITESEFGSNECTLWLVVRG